jgi:hypothetical protein
VTGTRCTCAAFSSAAYLRRAARDHHAVRHAVGGAAGIGGEDAAYRGAFGDLDAGRAQIGDEVADQPAPFQRAGLVC